MESRSSGSTSTSTSPSSSSTPSSDVPAAAGRNTRNKKDKSHGFDSGKQTLRLKERGLCGCPNVCGKGPFRTKEEVQQHKQVCQKEYVHNDYVKQLNHHESTYPVESDRVTYERGATRATARRPIVGFKYTGGRNGARFLKDM